METIRSVRSPKGDSSGREAKALPAIGGDARQDAVMVTPFVNIQGKAEDGP